jgi:hypothetical protein
MTPTLPDPDARLVERLRSADPTVSADVAAAHLDGLIAHLRRCNPTVDEQVVNSAAVDALVGLFKNPLGFDPTKLTLGAYLRMAAAADLKNLLKQELRHHRGRASPDCVEDAPDGRNEDRGEPDGLSFDDPALAAVIAGFSPVEKQFLDLMRAGEKRTSELAAVLGLSDRPGDEQQAEAKKVRDRLIKRLQRGRGGP